MRQLLIREEDRVDPRTWPGSTPAPHGIELVADYSEIGGSCGSYNEDRESFDRRQSI